MANFSNYGPYGIQIVTPQPNPGAGGQVLSNNFKYISDAIVAVSGHTHSLATTSSNGFMSAADKIKLDTGSYGQNISASGYVYSLIGFFGPGSGITDINASNISTGTLANARTTGTTTNTASTLVLRGVSGGFSAGSIIATSFSGNGASLTSLNATNISTGTIANARTTGTANASPNTLVLRDADGDANFGVVSANTAILWGGSPGVTALKIRQTEDSDAHLLSFEDIDDTPIAWVTQGGMAFFGVSSALSFQLEETSIGPNTTNLTANDKARMYVKGDKFIVAYNDAGTIKYRYMDLTSTDSTWTYTTTAP